MKNTDISRKTLFKIFKIANFIRLGIGIFISLAMCHKLLIQFQQIL